MGTGKWLNVRLRDLQTCLSEQGHRVSLPVMSRLLKQNDYALRANRKQREGGSPAERDQQFQHLADQRAQHQDNGQPVISVDTKKKELVGNFKNAGQIWCQSPEVVNTHDFPSDALGRAVPYGIYDPQHNRGTVYVGRSADTPAFAVDCLVAWCRSELPQRFQGATHLLIEADSGGSNSARSRVWKRDLQDKVADAFDLIVTVCHYPTGASKWNPIEHRLFSEISKTWAGCPLRSFEDVLSYIQQTTTQTGLTVLAHLITQSYAKGVKVPDREMKSLNLRPHVVCPQWNYTLYPRSYPLPC
jgi:hypothetical protein